MTPAQRFPRIDLTGPCLVLAEAPGAGVDVVLVDLTDVAPAEVAGRLAEVGSLHGGGVGVIGGRPPAVGAAVAAGAGLVVLDVSSADPAEVRAVVESGAVVVVHHADPSAAVRAVDALAAAHLDTSRVVVEVGPDPSLVEEVTVLERSAYGFRVGAVLGLPSGAAGWSEPERDGWEIGTLVALLAAGTATVRGVDPVRCRRVAAVLQAIDDAAQAGSTGDPVAGEPVASAAAGAAP